MRIVKTGKYDEWFAQLRDARAASRIRMRVSRLAGGNPGDAKSVGEGVMEMRIDYGPGYRVYFTRRGSELVVLLVGGDKSTQRHDIELAKEIAKEIEKGNIKWK